MSKNILKYNDMIFIYYIDSNDIIWFSKNDIYKLLNYTGINEYINEDNMISSRILSEKCGDLIEIESNSKFINHIDIYCVLFNYGCLLKISDKIMTILTNLNLKNIEKINFCLDIIMKQFNLSGNLYILTTKQLEKSKIYKINYIIQSDDDYIILYSKKFKNIIIILSKIYKDLKSNLIKDDLFYLDDNLIDRIKEMY